MAIGFNGTGEYEYRMMREMEMEKCRMYEEIRAMQGMRDEAHKQAAPEKPKKPAYLNPKLLLTKGL